MIETITWVPVAERLPDDEITVLLYTPVQNGDVWPGWYEDGIWRWSGGEPAACEITHWSTMPAGPRG